MTFRISFAQSGGNRNPALLVTTVATAQQSGSTDPTDLTVLDRNWRKESSSQQVNSNRVDPMKIELDKHLKKGTSFGLLLPDQSAKKYRGQFKEEIVIHRIVYSDGSAWQGQP
jgi:hypothetical protein